MYRFDDEFLERIADVWVSLSAFDKSQFRSFYDYACYNYTLEETTKKRLLKGFVR